MEQNIQLAKKLNVYAWIVTGAVIVLVTLMRYVDLPVEADLSFLPPFYSALNALTAVVLIVGLYFIKNKKMTQHRTAMMIAFGLSALFLLSYVAYHFTAPPTLFGDANHDGIVDAAEKAAVGGIRTFYLILLLTHVVLAATSFPFILFTFIRSYTGQFEKHKKMARWVFPIWLYVAITGPICFYMLMPYYK